MRLLAQVGWQEGLDSGNGTDTTFFWVFYAVFLLILLWKHIKQKS